MALVIETPASTVLWLLDLSDGPIWLDGGWGVDALVGHQTRLHGDVDIVIEEKYSERLVAKLRQEGFEDIPCDDTRPCNFVLGSGERGVVDFHLVRFDADGRGVYGIPEPEWHYPAASFFGKGKILSRSVKCTTAAHQMEIRSSGYPIREKDIADVATLAAVTGEKPPARFR